MSTPSKGWSLFFDILAASKIVYQRSWRRKLTSWVFVPFGIVMILLACFGVSSLLALGSVSFPASVACMILLFLGLVLCDICMGDRRTKQVLKFIDIPAGFALRYINIFFTPSFVLLPLSPSISGIEVAKIIAVFVIGFLVMMAVTAYMTRGLELVLGSSKRAITERAEEMGHEDDSIPLAATSPAAHTQASSMFESHPSLTESSPDLTSDIASDLAADLTVPPHTQDPSEIRGTGGPPVASAVSQEAAWTRGLRLAPVPPSRPQKWAAFTYANFDQITYSVLFLFVGIPIYYFNGYAMPIQLTVNILAYFAALSLPARWKQFFHPVLVSSLITVIAIWILGLIRGETLDDTLEVYKTGTKYLQLWRGEQNLPAPGAGDIFSSILDASIVSLALPMFQYRKEMKSHFFAIIIPSTAISVGSLFGYPPLCYAIGISPERSLSFTSRSLTLALAIPAVDNLGGDPNTVAAVAIMSGIMGVLIGQRMLRYLQIPEGDYVTRGVTLGANSSAIATALLLLSDPRAAALSCLSMSLFGTITVILTSIPLIVNAIRSLVELGPIG